MIGLLSAANGRYTGNNGLPDTHGWPLANTCVHVKILIDSSISLLSKLGENGSVAVSKFELEKLPSRADH